MEKNKKFRCRFCRSKRTARRGFRYNRKSKKQLYLCLSCSRKFTEDDGFLKSRFDKKIIMFAIKLYRKGKSSSQVRDELKRKNIFVSRWTIIKWNKKY
jgi:transposase-like protein